ncbi:hypothetical protein [Alicyclobacillus dauci]|uniref:DUF2273 domain-containing protein n=1 Tax=Alicyclobacillus dauci TaxID=1475485 RepID=A0ABY6YY96_9BACL|nr:hypothetical protein [Alicyclobacillus dauci]WAH35551.1 hypothetical protein NZD86_14795 [Alicyclobacillus dauci]
MQKTRPLRYLLFGLIFALTLVGIILHNYIALAVLMVCGIVIGILGDFVENNPTKPYQANNRFHNRHQGHHDAQA